MLLPSSNFSSWSVEGTSPGPPHHHSFAHAIHTHAHLSLAMFVWHTVHTGTWTVLSQPKSWDFIILSSIALSWTWVDWLHLLLPAGCPTWGWPATWTPHCSVCSTCSLSALSCWCRRRCGGWSRRHCCSGRNSTLSLFLHFFLSLSHARTHTITHSSFRLLHVWLKNWLCEKDLKTW